METVSPATRLSATSDINATGTNCTGTNCTGTNWARPLPVILFLMTAIVGIAADLGIKAWAQSRLDISQFSFSSRFTLPRVIHLIPTWIDLEWTYNHGAALGSFQGHRWMFLIVSTGAMLFLGYLFTAAKARQYFYHFILGLLLAGVVGNMYDRVVLGAVRDMIHALPDRHWPPAIAAHLPGAWGGSTELFPWIFNIADTLLCVGVVLMLLYSFIYPLPPKRPVAQPPTVA